MELIEARISRLELLGEDLGRVRPECATRAADGTDHHSGGPWVMWPGTPYEHLHIPVR